MVLRPREYWDGIATSLCCDCDGHVELKQASQPSIPVDFNGYALGRDASELTKMASPIMISNNTTIPPLPSDLLNKFIKFIEYMELLLNLFEVHKVRRTKSLRGNRKTSPKGIVWMFWSPFSQLQCPKVISPPIHSHDVFVLRREKHEERSERVSHTHRRISKLVFSPPHCKTVLDNCGDTGLP